MIRGIHYFSAEVKPKLMSSQGAALNFHPVEVVSRYRDPQFQVGENYAHLQILMF